MKKLFLTFTALVGALSGLFFTSCGGGGGGDLTGTVFRMNEGYRIVFLEQEYGVPGSYYGKITDLDGDHGVEVSLELSMGSSGLDGALGRISQWHFQDPGYPEVIVQMFGNLLNNVTVTQISKYEGAYAGNAGDGGDYMFKIDLEGQKVILDWRFKEAPRWKDEKDNFYYLLPSTTGSPDGDEREDGRNQVYHTGSIVGR